MLGPAADLKLATAALGSAADRKLAAACAEMTAELNKMTAAAFGPAADTIKAAMLGPAIRQLVRRDGSFALYGQLLDNVRTYPSIDPLLAEESSRPNIYAHGCPRRRGRRRKQLPRPGRAASGNADGRPRMDRMGASLQHRTPTSRDVDPDRVHPAGVARPSDCLSSVTTRPVRLRHSVMAALAVFPRSHPATIYSPGAAPQVARRRSVGLLLLGEDKEPALQVVSKSVSIRHARGPSSVRERASGLGSGGGI